MRDLSESEIRARVVPIAMKHKMDYVILSGIDDFEGNRTYLFAVNGSESNYNNFSAELAAVFGNAGIAMAINLGVDITPNDVKPPSVLMYHAGH